MKRVMLSVAAAIALAGCAQIGMKNQDVAPDRDGTGQVRPMARPGGAAGAIRPPAGARTAEQFDTTSAAEKQAAQERAQAAQASGRGKSLGRTVASLGDPAQPGLWIKTPLANAPGRGRVVYPANGKAVELDLIPIEGPKTGGSRMSLAALRALEAPLADLPVVEVYTE